MGGWRGWPSWAAGSGGWPWLPGSPRRATRSPCSSAGRGSAARSCPSSATGSRGTAARRTPCCRPWCATCSASPDGRPSVSSTWSSWTCCASTGSPTAPPSGCRQAPGQHRSRPSTRSAPASARAGPTTSTPTRDDWEVLRREYLERPWDPDHLPAPLAARLRSRETLARRVRRLKDDRLRLMALYPSLAEGHDPRDVPAWVGVTSYVEQRFGAWTVTGGMGVLAEALSARLATRKVDVHTASEVRDLVLRGGRVVAVDTAAGELDADLVVVACDPRRLPALAPLVRRTMPALPPGRVPPRPRGRPADAVPRDRVPRRREGAHHHGAGASPATPGRSSGAAASTRTC